MSEPTSEASMFGRIWPQSDRQAALWTGAAAITAGLLFFLSNLFSEYLLTAEEDGEIVRLSLFLIYVAAYGLGAVALVLALRGLRMLYRVQGGLTRAGGNGLRAAAAGAVLQALFAAVYFATAAATGDAADTAFVLFALGFLLLIGGSLTAGVSMIRSGVQRPVGALLLVAAAAAIVTIVTPAPVHDVGLFLFDAVWIGIGLALASRRPSPAFTKRVATRTAPGPVAATDRSAKGLFAKLQTSRGYETGTWPGHARARAGTPDMPRRSDLQEKLDRQ